MASKDTMAQCLSPIRLKNTTDQGFKDVPCGRCGYCLQNKRKEWSFRLQKELRQHESAFFLTLTYHDLSLPFVDVDSDGETLPIPSLCKEDMQKFMKRLRKKQEKIKPGMKLKYYAVGEYGSKSHRPHYHAIIYSLHPGVIPFLSELWSIGFIHVGSVNNDSIDYITKYVINKYDHVQHPVPPFALISNGIGLEHYYQNKNYYDNAQKVRNNRGYDQVVPRYYRNKTVKNPFTKAIAAERRKLDSQKAELKEIERISKLHPDPQSSFNERKVDGSDGILRKAKKGDRL